MTRERSPFESRDLRPLQPWAEAFGAMPEDHVLLVGRMVAALSRLVDATEDASRDGLSELDSFDDLVPSGPIERLIASELIWLQLMPEEFVRRIAEQEALRRRAIYRDPTDDRAIIALFDAGPEMLGRPRLVSIGALLALGIAARRRGARLIWTSTGFDRAPFWMEGLDRRGLARFAHQPAAERLSEDWMRERFASAPEEADEGAFWLVTRRGERLAGFEPEHRIEIDEIWPRPAIGPGAPPHRPVAAEATHIAQNGARRDVRVDYPDEALCAATLRGPFRAAAIAAGASVDGDSGWAPTWIAQEADLGSFYLSLNGEIVVRRPHSRGMRIRLPADGELLGIRSGGNGLCDIVWREGRDIRYASHGRPLRGETASASLAADHPLLQGAHRPDAIPTALRFGNKAGVTVAAPDGRLFDVEMLGEWAVDALSISPQQNCPDVRVRARAQSWLVCEYLDGRDAGLVMVKPKSGRRMPLRREPERPIKGAIRRCFSIGETGGVILEDDHGPLWIPPQGWDEDAAAPPPLLPDHAILLRVDPHEHQNRHGGREAEQRHWSLWAWSPENGVQEFIYANKAWREQAARRQVIDGQPLAMAMAGKMIYALIEDGSGERRLIEFNRSGAQEPVASAERSWYTEAPCVAL